jgi:hypothetical protein
MCFHPYLKRGFEGECHAMPQRFRPGRGLPHRGRVGRYPSGDGMAATPAAVAWMEFLAH